MKTLLEVMNDRGLGFSRADWGSMREADCFITEVPRKCYGPRLTVIFRQKLLDRARLVQGDKVMVEFDEDTMGFRYAKTGWTIYPSYKGMGGCLGICFTRVLGIPLPEFHHVTKLEVIMVDPDERLIVVRRP